MIFNIKVLEEEGFYYCKENDDNSIFGGDYLLYY